MVYNSAASVCFSTTGVKIQNSQEMCLCIYILHRMAFVFIRLHTFSFYTFCNTYKVLHTYDHSIWIPTVRKDKILEASILMTNLQTVHSMWHLKGHRCKALSLCITLFTDDYGPSFTCRYLLQSIHAFL